MRNYSLFAILLILGIGSCKKNDLNFDKFKNTTIRPDILTPLAKVRVVASDFLKEDSIIKYDPDGLIRLSFEQKSVFTVNADSILKKISLGTSATRFTIGEIAIQNIQMGSQLTLLDLLEEASTAQKNLLNALNGTTDLFPSVNTSRSSKNTLPSNGDFEFLKISEGDLTIQIRNGLPTTMDQIEVSIFDKISSANPELLGTLIYTNILPGATAEKSIDLSGKSLSNDMGYTIPLANIKESTVPVPISLADEIQVQASIQNLKCIGGKAKLPQQTIPDELLSLDLSGPESSAMLRNIEFGTAGLPIKTTSTVNTAIKVTLELPDASKNGNALNPLVIDAGVGTSNNVLDLSGANIFLGNDLSKDHNMLRVSTKTLIQASSGMVNFDSSDYIEIEFDASTAKFEYLDGYLGRDTFDISIDDLDVSELAKLGKGIRMEDPRMRIMVENSYGIPVLVELDITSKDEQGNILSMNVPEMPFPYPSIAERGTTKDETFEISKNNSNIVNCLGMPAVLFDIKGRAIMNPNGFQGFTNHITSKSEIDLGFAADIPMTFTAQNFQRIDTLEQGKSLQGLSDFDLLELKIKSINGFPLGGSIDLVFADSSYSVIDSVMDISLLQSAIVNGQGKITASSNNLSTFTLTGSLLKKLDDRKVTYLFLKTKLNTYDQGNVPVSIFSDCALDISLAFRAIYKGEL
jgi:hypothetical protein